jgi:N-acetylmuramoyl-L-alanine amidase
VFLDISSVRLGAGLVDQTLRFDGDNQPVRQIRTGRHPNQTARVVLEAAAVASYRVYALQAPFRVVIECVAAKVGGPPPVAVKVAQPAPPVLQARRLPPEATSPLPSARLASADLLLEARRAEPVQQGTMTPPVVPSRATAPAGVATVPPVAPITSVSTSPASATTATSVASVSGTLAADTIAPAVAVAPPSRNLAGGFSMARQLGLGVSRIVIDPGHGGHDPGAKGRGVTEAEVVLDVALRLEKLLMQVPGVEVVLTRRTDDYVPLEQRTALANRAGADLFLSIHANASNNMQASGVETYFLNFASNLSAASVAARENAASGQTMGALPDFVKTIALNNKLDESKDFATYVQRAMIEALRPANKSVRDLGVKQAPFVVLIGAAMPSVLAEISFITNSQDARLLKNGNYRQRIADALFKAVQKYQASLKSVGKVAAQ